MKILFLIHYYPPNSCAGGEMYCHNLAKYFITKGHEVIVLLQPEYRGRENKELIYEGVNISLAYSDEFRYVSWCDVVFTHLDLTNMTIEAVKKTRPIVWIAHNTFFNSYESVLDQDNIFVIYNSYTAKKMSPLKNKSCVLRPPCYVKEVLKDTNDNEFITLINVSKEKGGEILKQIAKKMPERKFLAVLGAYGHQTTGFPKNVKVMPHTNNIQEVYKKTRLILMPSVYESWGMVATEAMHHGIPVLSSECCFGLKENLSKAGTFIELNNISKWVSAIKLYDSKIIYENTSNKGKIRADELNPEWTLSATEDDVKVFVENFYKSL